LLVEGKFQLQSIVLKIKRKLNLFKLGLRIDRYTIIIK